LTTTLFCHQAAAAQLQKPAEIIVAVLTGRKFSYGNLVQIMSELAQKNCVPCKGGVPPLKGNDLARLARELGEGWRVVNEHHLEREYKIENFRKALDFTNQVGELAEQQNHHPDIYLAWGKVKLTLWTHKIDGLTESDFVFAAKVNQIAMK
jgi:4a-hydroxytetrahydrobiopterin dehydratase